MTTIHFPRSIAHLLALGLILAPALAGAQFPTVSLTQSAVSVDETAGTVTVTVVIDGPGNNGGALYQTVQGTADDTDYQPASGFLFWEGADSSPRDITITIIDDGVPEGDETFTVELTSGDGANIGSPSVVTVTITEGGGGIDAFFVFDDAFVADLDGLLHVPLVGGQDAVATLRLTEFPATPVTVDLMVGSDPMSVVFDDVQERQLLISSPPQPVGPFDSRFIQIVTVAGKAAKSLSAEYYEAFWAWLEDDIGDPCPYCAINQILARFGFGICDGRCAAAWHVDCPGDPPVKAGGSGATDILRRYRDEILQTTLGGRAYVKVYENLSGAVLPTLVRSPTLLYDVLRAQDAWIAGFEALLDGSGDSYVITQQMQDDMLDILGQIGALGNGTLDADLQREIDRVQLGSVAGLTMTQFQTRVEESGALPTRSTSWSALKADFQQ